MKLTSKDCNKMIMQLTRELELEKAKERNGSSFIAATIEDKEAVRPEYDYKASAERQDELNEKIMRLKHALNVFNTTTIVPEFDKTIDEMLIYIPILSNKRMKLADMLEKPKFERLLNHSRSSIIEYSYINYDPDEVKEDYQKVDEELTRAQIALDKVNISIEFEV